MQKTGANFKNVLISIASFLLLTMPKTASAHCPLCTAGAGILAIAAVSVGVKTVVVGLFIGAFSLALGIWIARLIKKKYFKYQDLIISIIVALSTILPIMPLIEEYRPFYISFFGQYGTLLNNTYAINLYLLGAICGAILFFASAYISKFFTKVSGKKFSFQSMAFAFGLLIIVGVLLQLTV